MRSNFLWYQYMRYIVVGIPVRLFYRKTIISGRKNIPKDKPVVFIPNHQNSFLDAFLVVCNVWTFIYFLTRAGVFSNPIAAWFLGSLNMLPVYRVRDGVRAVKKNEAIFAKCVRYLARKDAILVFAEANHNLKRGIRSISKGFTRVVFGAETEHNWQLDIQMIPVGINYDEHRKGGNRVLVQFGKPIPVSNYKTLFEEDENAATQQMTDDVTQAMKELVFQPSANHPYEIQKILVDDFNTDRNQVIHPFEINPVIKRLAEETLPENWVTEAEEIQKQCDRIHVQPKTFIQHTSFSFVHILLAPLLVFSLLNNLLPAHLVRKFIKTKIKDHAFDASLKIMASITVFPLFYGLICLVLMLIGLPSELIWTYLGISFVTAPFYYRAKAALLVSEKSSLHKKHPELANRIMTLFEESRSVRSRIHSSVSS
ncbi:MAG: 1-acyl-sn-glycerol-3-phosphate acyltransferase [Bacteroidota bacterium]